MPANPDGPLAAAEISAAAMPTVADVVGLGHATGDAKAYLHAASALLSRALPVDAVLAIRQPARGAWVVEHAQGVPREMLRRLVGNWECYRSELAPVFDSAARHGAAVDADELGRGLTTTRYFIEVAAPQRAVATAIVLLRWQGTALGAFVLGRRRGFSKPESDLLRELSPSLAMGLAAHLRAAGAPVAGLTRRECEVVSYVCLGYTNKEALRAAGILSPNFWLSPVSKNFWLPT